jgi:hypothetical protein
VFVRGSKLVVWSVALLLIVLYSLTAPANHTEAEDVYDFSRRVEQGSFADQAGVNRLLALPVFGVAYHAAQMLGYSGRAFPFMIIINRFLAVASLLFFHQLLAMVYRRQPSESHSSSEIRPLISVLCLAFSYGFWRYANEAETYMLASALLLCSWCLVVKGRWVFGAVISALGIMIHLLNLIPLLLAIPLYYLLSKDWKKAFLHGAITGLLVALAYGICFHMLDWGELGAQHHTEEAGFNPANVLRGGIAFGQCLVSGNFLFGFEGFRELLVEFFPSRMLGEEFFMAENMHGWIKWAGCTTLPLLAAAFVWLVVRGVRSVRASSKGVLNPLVVSCAVWVTLYIIAVIRTESGSPELWILGLVPFWLLVARLLQGFRTSILVAMLFIHNLVAGLLPVMPADSDYHAAKGRWLVENSTAEDLILTSYEPVMIFYLDYFSPAKIVNSGAVGLEKIHHRLGVNEGEVYALASLFQPLESMKIRNPKQYDQMARTGEVLLPRFDRIVENEFGGIYQLKPIGE